MNVIYLLLIICFSLIIYFLYDTIFMKESFGSKRSEAEDLCLKTMKYQRQESKDEKKGRGTPFMKPGKPSKEEVCRIYYNNESACKKTLGYDEGPNAKANKWDGTTVPYNVVDVCSDIWSNLENDTTSTTIPATTTSTTIPTTTTSSQQITTTTSSQTTTSSTNNSFVIQKPVLIMRPTKNWIEVYIPKTGVDTFNSNNSTSWSDISNNIEDISNNIKNTHKNINIEGTEYTIKAVSVYRDIGGVINQWSSEYTDPNLIEESSTRISLRIDELIGESARDNQGFTRHFYYTHDFYFMDMVTLPISEDSCDNLSFDIRNRIGNVNNPITYRTVNVNGQKLCEAQQWELISTETVSDDYAAQRKACWDPSLNHGIPTTTSNDQDIIDRESRKYMYDESDNLVTFHMGPPVVATNYDVDSEEDDDDTLMETFTTENFTDDTYVTNCQIPVSGSGCKEFDGSNGGSKEECEKHYKNRTGPYGTHDYQCAWSESSRRCKSLHSKESHQKYRCDNNGPPPATTTTTSATLPPPPPPPAPVIDATPAKKCIQRVYRRAGDPTYSTDTSKCRNFNNCTFSPVNDTQPEVSCPVVDGSKDDPAMNRWLQVLGHSAL